MSVVYVCDFNHVVAAEVAQCFPLLIIGYPFNYRDFPLFDKIRSKSSAAELSYEGKCCRGVVEGPFLCSN